MYIEKTINKVTSTNMTTNFNQYRDAFYDVFQQALNNKSNSRPPKIELTGVLIPCNKVFQGIFYKFKLETDSKEYLLSMSKSLTEVAEKIEWDEVTVKGYLDLENHVFETEKISLSRINDPTSLVGFGRDPYFEVESYKRTIEQRGKIEPALDDLAS